ncbi:MAG: polyprenyl synthetase family protein [Armatimonadota bacterium]|nr:MAG: polyprenyl synthetase family protein [Armatimonadota bacterium]
MKGVIEMMRSHIVQLNGAGGALLREMLLHHLGWDAVDRDAGEESAGSAAGKLVRPRLCVLSCLAVGGNAAAAIPAAAAIELIHNFSLIHDDIEDRDDTRRGRPAVWKLWGEAQGINAGDCMYSLAYAVLTEPEEATADPGRRLRATAILSRACARLCEGQAHDVALRNGRDVSEDEYLDMVGRKTGALLSAAAETGALLGGADDRALDGFRDFGFDLGVAFQIRDDVLGIWGDAQKTGKPVGGDLSRRRCSYPVVWALARGRDKDRHALRDVGGASSPRAMADAVAVLDRVGAREHAEELAAETHRRAWSALEGLRLESAAKDDLRRLTEFLAVRQR